MNSFELTTINGVTRQQVNGDKYVYLFPTCTIEAYPDADPAVSYFFQYVRGESYKRYFDDVTDKLGQSDLIAFLDECATQSIFFDISGVGAGDATAANQVIQISEAQTANTLLAQIAGSEDGLESILEESLRLQTNKYFNNIEKKLDEIVFFLKALAE